ncbi:alpha/beta fold hydrolase [Microbacterium sp. Sa4CUA7]|uniref:Alpha/beta fold hydrolase n=1 Tax=Microbacterium pullorum TaxID=2762236 RepID=A0ABR8S2W1_9MICO|nr:alpha/beta fold hydrolase [Microbacterium pullorum]MBD7957812.1 alpha/beta fold hydrolase [Microbacterium pullorum]
MMASRRAVSPGAPLNAPTLLRALLVALSAALVGVVGAMGVLAVRMARRVVTPSGRVPDTTIVDLDTAAQTITLTRTPDTELPGRYGLFTTGTSDYIKLGSVLSEDDATVKRKLLTHVPADAHLAPAAAFSGWYFDEPGQLHLPYTPELIGGPLGPCPAWLFPAGESADTWVIQVHGRGTTRAECLRAVPVFHEAGITCLLVSYRNDGEGPRSRTGTYALGATEWRDADAAVGFARRRGAKRVVLMGWSMGGAIVLQVELNSAHRDLIVGVVLESPVLDWRIVLGYQAKQLKVPAPVTQLAIEALRTEWATSVTGAGAPIPFDRLDVVARAGELRHPVLILHSDDDGFVPSDASYDLVVARPDLVEFEIFEVARHTKLWNYDQDRWNGRILNWLRVHGLAAVAAPAGD